MGTQNQLNFIWTIVRAYDLCADYGCGSGVLFVKKNIKKVAKDNQVPTE